MEGGLLKVLLPQIPSLANTALLHGLGRTPTSSKWDLRTALTVQVMRTMMSTDRPPVPVGKAQATTTKDLPIKGKTWVAKTTIVAPGAEGENVREMVWKAIDDLRPDDSGELEYTRPSFADVQIEWTGFRPDAGKEDPMPESSEQDKYKRLMEEPTRTSDTTILYFHGGAYYLCDPATHRVICSQLAKESKGRVCSVRYRLAPRTAFPGQLLDGLMVYLSLLYPPPGSMHEAVPAKNIVFGGDSAGGNLSFALLQLLLQFHRTSDNPTTLFHGREVSIPLPAGVTGASPWLDIGRSLPSKTTNAGFDYLPPPNDDFHYSLPADDMWPTDPPRGDFFCDLTMIDHPLVSPVAAKDWTGSPPILINVGQESLEDDSRCVGAAIAKQGVPITYESYESMPHVFAVMLPALSNAKRCTRSWGDFCRKCVESPESLSLNGTYIHAKTGKEVSIDVKEVANVSPEEAKQLMSETKLRRMQRFERERSNLAKPTKAAL